MYGCRIAKLTIACDQGHEKIRSSFDKVSTLKIPISFVQ